VSFAAPAGFTAATPAAGATGVVTATNPLLAAAASASFTLVVAVDPTATEGVPLTATATATATNVDPATGNNTAAATVAVGNLADLAVAIDDGASSVDSGSPLSYTITLRNDGPGLVPGVILSAVLPAALTGV